MFRPWGSKGIHKIPVKFKGRTHEVTITLSYAADEARRPADGQDPGHKAYGKLYVAERDAFAPICEEHKQLFVKKEA